MQAVIEDSLISIINYSKVGLIIEKVADWDVAILAYPLTRQSHCNKTKSKIS